MESRRMIRLVVAEDDPLARQTIRAYVGRTREIDLVAEAIDGRQALAVVEEHQPDVLLTDINMPELNGIDLTSAVLSLVNPPAVVCFTALADEETMRTALEAGACGFILKTDRPEVMIHGIRSAFTGDAVVSPKLLAAVLATVARRGRVPDSLGASERDLLRHIGCGMSNFEIAGVMFLSPATVKTYVSRLLLKTSSRNRAQLAARAYQWGLVHPDAEGKV